MARRLCWTAFLLFALLFAQTWGLIHHVTHARGLTASAAALHGEGERVGEAHGAPGWAQKFSAHADDGGCVLYDQLSHGDSVVFAPLYLPAMAPSAGLLAVLLGEFVARWAALFQARGPPLSR